MSRLIKPTIFILTLFIFTFLFSNKIVQATQYGHVIDCDKYNIIKYNKVPKKNAEIKELQRWLKNNGYYKGKLDGVFGKKTVFGIRKFQKANNLKVDGIVGNNTWKKIGNYRLISFANINLKSFKGNNEIFINLLQKNLTLIINNKPYKNYNVAIGKLETPTPIGQWFIKRKSENWGTGFGSRWMGLNVNWGLYGIHGTNKPWSIGNPASHGCIRMNNKDIEILYNYVNAKDKVNIFGNPFGYLNKPLRVLMKGEKGTDVNEIQKQLKRLGYYKDSIDGIFGTALEKSVKEMQRDMKVVVTAQIREKEYQRLGFGKVSEVRERKS